MLLVTFGAIGLANKNVDLGMRRSVLPQASKQEEQASLTANSKALLMDEVVDAKTTRRYILDAETGRMELKSDSPGRTVTSGDADSLRYLMDFCLPAGFPGSVSDDYLKYMLWQLPTNITAWICRALITSSLLQAVGLSAGPGTAAASAAAIKWVTKDGLGAIGRLFIGGRFGSVFDEDPKQWRMFAEVIGSAGGLFELATPLAPDYFLPLASFGYLTKAVAKALKEPSFRVIQNHFSIAENVGDVAAKEEVWEVAGQLIGLSLGVALLSTPAVSSSYTQFALCWGLIRSLHLWLRYQSLAALELPTLNYKRLSILISEHIQGRPLSGVVQCNRKEDVLLPRQFMKPKIDIGCSWQDVMDPGWSSSLQAKQLLDSYEAERYILFLGSNGEAQVLLKDGASSVTIARSMYQAYHLFHSDSGSSSLESLKLMQRMFPSFARELGTAGWNLNKLVVKVPSSAPVYNFKT